MIGIFVGGKGLRMGGVAKGLLNVPDGNETLIARLLRVCSEAAPLAEVCLIGQATAYGGLGLPVLADQPSGVGPIGGLKALLEHAQARGAATALALACDLPFLDASVIARLLTDVPRGARVPLALGRRQPLAAAYAPGPALGAVNAALRFNTHALMRVLELLGDGLECLDFLGSAGHALTDWDHPEDVTRVY